jgi:hypothetical protein
MYSNSKEQVSLEDAYRKVHLVTEEKKDWCDKHKEPRSECPCEECDKCGSEHCNCQECQESEEDEVNESILGTAVQAGAHFIADRNADQLKADMIGWVGALASGTALAALLAHRDKAAHFVEDALMVANFNKLVDMVRQDLKGDDVRDLKKAHNLKIKLLKLLGYKLVAWGIKKGLLKDPEQEHDFIDNLVDKSEEKAAELRQM